jgi:hypothetical protein
MAPHGKSQLRMALVVLRALLPQPCHRDEVGLVVQTAREADC